MAFKRSGIVYVLTVLVAVVVLFELLALPLLSRVNGRRITREELAQSLHDPEDTPSQTGGPERGGGEEKPEWMLGHVLHPFLGFVRNYDAPEHFFNGRAVAQPVNRFGFFGAPLPDGHSDGRRVVAITGGSAALDLYLRSGPVIREALEGSPRFAGKRIEIVSLALGGVKQPQQLMALSWFLSLGRGPDILINFDGFNEIALPFAENTPFGVAPCFPRSWRTYAASGFNSESAGRFGQMQERREKVARWRRRLSTSPLRRSAAVLAFWKGWSDRESAAIARLEEEIRETLRDKNDLTYQESGPPADEASPAKVFHESSDIWRESSLQMLNLCRANDIDYFHFLQPNQHLPGSKKLTDWERRYAVAGPGYAHVRAVVEGYPLLQEAGRQLAAAGLSFVDLTGIFESESEDIYADQCCHYNQRGNDIIAREIARVIGGLPPR